MAANGEKKKAKKDTKEKQMAGKPKKKRKYDDVAIEADGAATTIPGESEEHKASGSKRSRAEDSSAKAAAATTKGDPSRVLTRRSSKELAEGLRGDLADDARGDPSLSLSKFNISAETLEALRSRNIEALFPIQAATFDTILGGRDLIGRARTGMGKTLAFALPMVERILAVKRVDSAARARGRAPLGLVMAPTRELAQQVGREVETVAPSLVVLCVYGGAPMGPQVSALRMGVDVLVGTPGRIKDHMERGTLALTTVRFATLDEADQMLDMGFADDMSAILGACTNAERQTCLFSATMPPWVRDVAPKYMRTDLKTVDLVGDKDVKASTDVRHIAIPSHWSSRPGTINDVIAMYAGPSARSIVFCETKAECDDLLNSDALKFDAKPLHGDIPQVGREKTMDAFRNGKVRVLVATDVAARGLDMKIDLVVQNKPPVRKISGKPEVETYVHRSGRTGRAGKKGICVTLFGPRDREALKAIEKATKNSFEWLGAPNPKQMIRAAAETAVEDAVALPGEVTCHLADAARDLLARKGGDAEAALAAALAVATGTTEPPLQRSLLSNSDGYVTLRATMHKDVPSTGYVWGALRRVLPEGCTDGNENVRGMQLTADGKGAVFDVKESLVGELRMVLNKNDWLSVLDAEIPPLKEKDIGNFGSGSGWGGGRSCGGSGGRGASSPGRSRGRGTGGRGRGRGRGDRGYGQRA